MNVFLDVCFEFFSQLFFRNTHLVVLIHARLLNLIILSLCAFSIHIFLCTPYFRVKIIIYGSIVAMTAIDDSIFEFFDTLIMRYLPLYEIESFILVLLARLIDCRPSAPFHRVKLVQIVELFEVTCGLGSLMVPTNAFTM